MCGVAGVIRKRGSDEFVADFVNFANKMQQNRGPDAQGSLFQDVCKNQVHIDKNKPQDLKVGLAHQRLSIIDLNERANQPMIKENGKFALTYNGEIYNYKELRSELEGLGYKFDTTSDTEVVLYAMIEWGDRAPQKFIGMFAFGFLNNVDGTLKLVRDRIGIKPLHYYDDENYFLFASELHTLANWPDYDFRLNKRSFSKGFSYGIAFRPDTFFDDIQSVSQGSIKTISIDTGDIISDQYYWQLSDHLNQNDTNIDIEDISLMLQRAVKDRMVADVDLGVCLSAGLDSSVLAACISETGETVSTYTLYTPDKPEHNELPLAKDLSLHLGFENIGLPVHPDDILADAIDMMYCYQEPFFSLSPNYSLFKNIQKSGMKVVLNGLGGDELFGGYKYYSWIKYWKILKTLKLPKNIAATDIRLLDRLNTICAAKSASDYALAVRNSFTDRDLNNIFSNLMDEVMPSRKGELAGLDINALHFTDDIQEMNYIEIMTNVGNHHVHRLDAFSMRFGVEARVPFLDHRLVEMSMKLSSSLKVRHGNRKIILKKIASNLVPETILNAPKKGLSLPMDSWMKHELKLFVDDQINDLKKRHIVNSKGVDRVINQWRRGVRSYRGVWLLVAFEVWLKQFHDRQKDYVPYYAR